MFVECNGDGCRFSSTHKMEFDDGSRNSNSIEERGQCESRTLRDDLPFLARLIG